MTLPLSDGPHSLYDFGGYACMRRTGRVDHVCDLHFGAGKATCPCVYTCHATKICLVQACIVLGACPTCASELVFGSFEFIDQEQANTSTSVTSQSRHDPASRVSSTVVTKKEGSQVV